jgi:hypothetical protein
MSPPLRSPSESSWKVRVPTALAEDGASEAAETTRAPRRRRAAEAGVERIMLVLLRDLWRGFCILE